VSYPSGEERSGKESPPSFALTTLCSGTPFGPYVNETKVVDWFAHNPTITRSPDGTYLVWHIGDAEESGDFLQNCTNGTTPGYQPKPPHHRRRRTESDEMKVSERSEDGGVGDVNNGELAREAMIVNVALVPIASLLDSRS